MKKMILSLLCLLMFTGVQAQNKYSSQIEEVKKSYNQEKLTEFYVQFTERNKLRKEEVKRYALLNNIPIRYEDDFGVLKEIQFISEEGIPIYFTTFNVDAAISTRANYLNSGGGLSLDLNGDDLISHVWDAGLARTTHQEYDGAGGANRFSIGDGTTALHFHAAHVIGTIMASGVQATAKGMAWQSNVVGYDWNNDTSEATTAAANGMLVSNHSYGYGASSIPDDWFGQYWTDARDWDQIMYNAPYFLMMVAAGNDGNDNASNGSHLDGNSSYDKLSGHATAKNNMVVANGQDANINGDGSLNSVSINTSSSEGPTDDYRIKPDITGNGTGLYSTYESSNTAYNTITGTSMASPNVTGTLLLLQEHYNDLNGGFMRAATLKGLALHTADDAGPVGPDAVYGWGLLNAKKAAETLTTAAANSGSAIVDEITLNQGQTYQITVQSNGTDPLMASISWTDPAGALNGGTNSSTPALVNDLDIRLSNGSTFTPWRLTSITTNGTGDNVVDPYERIDVNGASGTYTLTVTHKGTLSSGSQNYSLIVTGVVVASTPVISFASTSGNTNENTDCNFTDIDVTLNIGQAPSGDALVTFSVNGASTATSLLDFDILTPTVTFLDGLTTAQTMTIRVYHDGFVEVDETAIIDFIVTGGDATAGTNADTFTLTINDDDLAPVSSFTVDLVNEDFELVPTGWLNADRDGDTFAWLIGTVGAAHLSTNQLFSRSWDSTNGVLTPDNYIITSQITIPASLTSLNLSYQVSPSTLTGSWYEEYYTVYWTTDISTYAAIDGSAQVKPGAIITQAVVNENIDMSAYIGQTGYLVFRHHNCTDEEYIAIDNLLLQGISEVNVQTAVNTGVTNDTQSLASAGTIYTSDSATGNVMLDITNNQADDYGCVDISVSRAGTGAQSYMGSVAPNLAMDKTFEISSTLTSAGTGSTTMLFYFTEAEIAGWEAVTGEVRANLIVGREVGGVLTEVSNVSIGAFGVNVTLAGNFSDVNGTYYFGAAGVLSLPDCTGVTTTWSGASWSDGVPDNTKAVIINGAWATGIQGNLDVCTLQVSSLGLLLIDAGDYVKVEGNITVDSGGTLNIQHEGSLVQVDDNATVIKNGNIVVLKTTPVATGNSFSILGSPMSATTRNGAYVDNNVVMNHDTSLFNLDATVTAVNLGADHFADAQGDNWLFMTGAAAINPSEGYLVGPTTASVGSGSYDLTYNEGTLNNGVYQVLPIWNGSRDESPNILSNPYASAIDAVAFLNDNFILASNVYFWEHLTAPEASYPGYRFENWDMGDISIMNVTGIGTAAPNDVTMTPPSQYIPSGQGFAVKIKVDPAGVPFQFQNSQRVTGPNTGYRTQDSSLEKLYIYLKNETYNLRSSMAVAFTNQATNSYDAGYETKRLATPISIYSVIDEHEIVIQARNVFNTDQVIPLGFRTMVEEVQTYTISLGSIEGDNLSNATVYLEDVLLGTVTNLSEGSYTFTSNESNQKDRFVIVFTEEQLGNNDSSLEAISLYPNPTQNILNIVSPLSTITNVEVYDVQGRVIASKTIANKSNYQLDMTTYSTAMYFVNVTTNDGSITKRVVRK